MAGNDRKENSRCKDIEEGLRTDRERLIAAQRISRIGNWDWDIVNNRLLCSDEIYRILGYSPGEIEPSRDIFFQHIHPDDKKYMQGVLEKALVTGKDYDVEHRFSSVNGSEGWLYNRGKVVLKEGLPVRIYGTTQDITERKQVERSLEDERNFIAAVNDNIGILVVVLDQAGKIIRYNRVCEVVTGLSYDEVKHHYYWDIFCLPEGVELYKAYFSSLSPENFPYEVEDYQHALDGTVRTVLWTSNVLLDQNGSVKNYIMTGLDITSRKEMENALRELGEKYRALIHASPVAVISLDNAARVKSWSAAAEQVLGWAEKDVLGKEIFLLIENKQLRNHDKAKHVLGKVFEGRSLSDIEFQCSRKDGSPVHINLSLAPLRSHNGEINGIVLVAADITVRKLTEETLKEERNKALQIHRRSLPLEFPVFYNIHLTAYYQPAMELRGDFYNAIRKGDQLLIYLIDVAGKGLDGVILSVFVREAIENYNATDNSDSSLSPGEVLLYLFEQYHRENGFTADKLCIFLAVLNLQTGDFCYTASGFTIAPLFVSAHGQVVELDVQEEVDASSAPTCFNVSPAPDADACLEFLERSVHFTPGSTLFFSTDGLVAQRFGDEPYGLRLRKVFMEHRHLPPELISRAVRKDCDDYYGKTQGEDDIAFLIVQAVERERCISFEVESDFAVIIETVEKVLTFLEAHAPVDTDLLDFHELLVNAIEHGNKRDGAKKVVVDVIVSEHYYKIVISDQGDGFNWRERMARELDMDNYFERGRGIIMTRLMANYLGYNERGNRVTLINQIE